jgi:hypothetical protein
MSASAFLILANVGAGIVQTFHYLIIAFVLFAPFTHYAPLLILHISLAICLLVHWAANSNVCFLSVLESNLRGMPYTQTFSHSMISGIYDISDSQINFLCKTVTIVTMILSFYFLYNSGVYSRCKQAYKSDDSYKARATAVMDCIFVQK